MGKVPKTRAPSQTGRGPALKAVAQGKGPPGATGTGSQTGKTRGIKESRVWQVSFLILKVESQLLQESIVYGHREEGLSVNYALNFTLLFSKTLLTNNVGFKSFPPF
uniref:Uncharacterized protein n=1 Tax=Anguilla anguilla TaxID=7936 RepID=A0A0E9XAI0_ANGAN